MKYALAVLVLLSLPAHASQYPQYQYDMSWDDFDNSVHQIQGNVGKYCQNRMCGLKQPELKPGEHGVVYHLKNGKCIGELK